MSKTTNTNDKPDEAPEPKSDGQQASQLPEAKAAKRQQTPCKTYRVLSDVMLNGQKYTAGQEVQLPVPIASSLTRGSKPALTLVK